MSIPRFPGRTPRHGPVAAAALLVAVPFLLAVPAADADTYKWVDRQGQVHYTDTPPPQGVPFDVIKAPAHSATPPPPPSTSPALQTAPPSPPPKPAPAVPADDTAAKQGACVDALYQIALLNEKQPVYKPLAGGKRHYIDDPERPAEIERLQTLRDANCSEDPATFQAQQRRARDLMFAMSRNCLEALDKLANYEDPATHTPDDQLERQRAFVAQYCRGAERTDLWRGDAFRDYR